MRRFGPALVACGAALAFLCGISASASAAVATVYVGGPGCSDTGQGTQTQPYCTIIKAASVAVAGQLVLVSGGTYTGPAAVKNSGTVGNPIVFRPASGAAVTVQGGQYGFSLVSRSYVSIIGFSITQTVRNGVFVSASDHITISGNVVTQAGVPASGQVAPGIGLYSTTASTVTGNTADNNSDSGIYLATGTTGTVVGNNEASANARGYQRNANGINVIGSGNSIIGNVLHDNEDSGLQFYPGGDDNLATLNVSYNNGDHGIDDLNVTGGRLIGNTIFGNCTSGINVEGTSGNYLVKNNIAVDNAVNPAYKGISCNRRAGNIGIWDSAPASTTVDSNLVFLSKAGTQYVFGSSYSSLAAMRSATGQEVHGLQANPGFVNPAAWDLRLAGGSPAIDSADSGASGEQATDALGAGRADDPGVANTGFGPRSYDDRGAYEFGGTSTPPPAPNQPPVARLALSSQSGTAPLAVTADAAASTDPEGQRLTYTFNFGDGTAVASQSAATATHSYTAAGTFTVTVTVADPAGLSSAASVAVTVGGAAGTPASYVSQIATNNSPSPHTSGSVTVWRPGGVTAGNLMVVTLSLTGTTAGTVTGTDDAGDVLTVASDVSDGAGHRLVLLSGVARTGLAPNQLIKATFPAAAAYRMTADAASGAALVDRHAEASGGGGAFSSGLTAATASANEFVFSAVGLYGGSAPTWATGWKALTSYAVGTDFLGRAYQISTAPGTFAGAGSGSGLWLASTVTFR